MRSSLQHILPLILFTVASIYTVPVSASARGYIPTDNKQNFLKNTYTYKTNGQCQMKADVYRFPDDTIRPAIIWIHGGALIFGSRMWMKEEQVVFYLQAGYTVISIDYRLAPETKLPQIIEDLQDAYSWVRKEGQVLSAVGDSVISATPDEATWKNRFNLFYIYCRQQGLWPIKVTGQDSG